MKERIREIAGELIATAAERALRPGDVIEPDASGYPSFVDRFPYEETDDQDRAIDDVLGDLAAGKPMDRLIVGDVGFGKTEVALRAAFVAAMAGMQVAVVCPTTLLARQHFNNFAARFEGFPIKIGRLSRLVPAAEAKATKEGLADGTIDVVIGTHAMLAKGIEFKRLGLVVVDEEQRFGVTHKERLKALKADVHVLTLTATPIPRTLQMAMSGLRELSVIQTPPVDRLAVRTYVMPWDPVVLREALLREHYRGGQSFFVTPRIADLPDIEEFLRERGARDPLRRRARPDGADRGRGAHVAPSTTRSSRCWSRPRSSRAGIDIPSANTMIVNRADRFGLAQLYQLRGRVGRSKTRAYAYMVTPPERHDDRGGGEAAEGAVRSRHRSAPGFQLASHDLDIRGAGNLLGDEQSGHIKEVGYELYQSMLEEAIMEAKAGGTLEPPDAISRPQITVDAPILIPEDYVPDLDLRMGLYRRLNELDEPARARGVRRRDDRPLRHAARRDRESAPHHRDQAQRQDARASPRSTSGRRARWSRSTTTASPNVDGLLAYVEQAGRGREAAARQQAGDQPRLGRRQGAAARRAAIVAGAGQGGGLITPYSALNLRSV